MYSVTPVVMNKCYYAWRCTIRQTEINQVKYAAAKIERFDYFDKAPFSYSGT